MPAGFLSKMIDTVDETMRNVKERESLKRDRRSLNGLRKKVTRKIAEVCLPGRQAPLELGSRPARINSMRTDSTRTKLPTVK